VTQEAVTQEAVTQEAVTQEALIATAWRTVSIRAGAGRRPCSTT
jgi:hypothetical protein